MHKKMRRNCYIFDKFSELNSQSSEKIIWSSSDSSDVENESFNQTSLYRKHRTRKRKHKDRVLKNTSKLEVTIVDANESGNNRKSPVLYRKQKITQLIINSNVNKQFGVNSPILSSPDVKYNNRIFMENSNSLANSSVKTSRRCSSPILEIKKKNTRTENLNVTTNVDNTMENGTKSPVLCLNKSRRHYGSGLRQDVKLCNFRNTLSEILNNDSEKCRKFHNKQQNLDKINDEFSSQKSHYSISESQSGESVNKLSADIDSGSSSQPSQTMSKVNRDESIKFSIKDLNNLKLKQRYQKNGLAYRLQNLLKRKNSSFSLWQNELYLSKTSNFTKPKEEFLAFRVQEISNKYGICLLRTVNLGNDDNYLIILNSFHVKNDLKKDTILKLYKPFKLLDWKLDDMQIILNAFKFECINVDMCNF